MQSPPVALITGASSGIGAAYARGLAGQGHDLVLVARGAGRLEALAAELKDAHDVATEVIAADLAEPAGLELVRRRVAAIGNLSHLIHSAGFNTPDRFADHEPDTVLRMAQLHATAAAVLAHAALGPMQARGEGAIVFLSSLAAFFTATGYVPYSATKAFLNMLAQGLAIEAGPQGIRVQVVCAGLVRTPFLETPAYRAFNPYAQVPEWVFLTPEQVVSESLAGLARGRTVLVPGALNRAFVRAMETPLLGKALVYALQKLSPARTGA